MSPIPDPPKYPPPDEGAGEFNSDPWWSTGDDEVTAGLARLMANAAETLGHTDAARHLRHYLSATGDRLKVEVDRIVSDVQSFRKAVKAETATLVGEVAKNAAKNDDFDEPLQFRNEEWKGAYLTKEDDANWFYALGGVRFAITGVVTVHKPGKSDDKPEVTLKYRVHLWDYYNWDQGKSTTIGPITVEDETMAELHRAGVAREYEVVGKTSEFRYSGPLPEAGALPDPDDDRGGGRGDPGRER